MQVSRLASPTGASPFVSFPRCLLLVAGLALTPLLGCGTTPNPGDDAGSNDGGDADGDGTHGADTDHQGDDDGGCLVHTECATGSACIDEECVAQAPIAITTDALPRGYVGAAYAASLSATGGVGSLSWSLDAKPPWLRVDAGSGELSGTPAESADAVEVVAVVADEQDSRAQVTLVLDIVACQVDVDPPLVCGKAVDGACWMGEQVCLSTGDYGDCELVDGVALPSSDPETCGESCSACDVEPSPDCVDGKCVCTSQGGDAPCDEGETCCEAGCADTETDPDNCGECEKRCIDKANASRGCQGESCQWSCNAPYADCDQDLDFIGGIPGTGCETDLRAEETCGACFKNCRAYEDGHENFVAGDDMQCVEGACAISCRAGHANCNTETENFADGCETKLSTTANCGACGAQCEPYANTLPECVTQLGAPGGHACRHTCVNALWDDCDGDITTGCETDLRELENCGACGGRCADKPHAAATVCQVPVCLYECETGYENCDGNMLSNGCEVDLSGLENCGSCGHSCSDAAPNNSVATCHAGSTDPGTELCTYVCMDGYRTQMCGGELYCDHPSAGTMRCGPDCVLCPIGNICQDGQCKDLTP